MGAAGGRVVQRVLAVPTALGAALLVPSALAAAYLGLLTVAGARRPRPRPPRHPSTRFAILVPAHNEEPGIAQTLQSLSRLDYPTELFRVHVVADNCTDDTAGVARRHDCEVYERTAPRHPGKGPALNWLRDQLVARADPFDAVVVVDADTSVDGGFLRAAAAAVRGPMCVAQGYYSVRDPESSPAASFRFAALACRHYLRPLGRTRLGGSCGLYGNGMVFTRDVVTTHDWSDHLVEDAELQNQLLLEGVRVAFVPDAVVYAEMPHDLADARSQNARWERGRVEVARRYAPRLAKQVVSGPHRRAAADAVCDHMTPPVSVLVGMQMLGVLLCAGGAASRRPVARLALAGHAAAAAVVAAHTVTGLVVVDARSEHFRALLGAPRQVGWKLMVWAQAASGRGQVSWSRTRRNSETAEPTGHTP